MSAWTPPTATTRLAVTDLQNVLVGLRGPASRQAAAAYLQTVNDIDVLHALAMEVAPDGEVPWTAGTGALRNFVLNNT